MSRVRQISRVAGRACYFAAGLSRLKGLFRFTLSRVRQISRVAGRACYFAAGLSRLKGLFRFTLSRVRQISRVAIPTGVAGFGLLEVLVASVVGTILISGSAKFMQITLQTSNVAKSILIENDFKATIAQGLKDKGCASSADDALLKPASLKTGTTTDDGIGEFKDAIALPGGIQKGDFKGSIEVIKMELRGVAGDDTRDFVVYYKKKHLGTLSAPDPENCTDTPAVKVTGCYNHYCTVAYDRTAKHCTGSVNCHSLSGGGGGVSESRVNTIIKEKLAPENCPDKEGKKQFSRGFYADPDGNLEMNCDTPPAPETQTLPTVRCPPKLFLKGFSFDADGNPQPDCACRDGKRWFETVRFFDVDGRTQRRTYEYTVGTPSYIPEEGEEFIRSQTRDCKCPSQDQGFHNGNCVTCKDGTKWVWSEKKCITCSGGGAYWRSSYNELKLNSAGWPERLHCLCPAGKKKKKVA